MTVQETSIPDSGQRVGLAVAPFQNELNDFSPLLAAETSRAELVTAIEAQQANRDTKANRRRGAAVSARRATGGPRIVRILPVTTASNQPLQLVKANYGPAYILTVENRSAGPLPLWVAQKDRAKMVPLTCATGAVTVLTRANLGPKTARHHIAQFQDMKGGEATVVVRRVV